MADFYALGLTLDSGPATRGWQQVTGAASNYGRTANRAATDSTVAMNLIAKSTGQTAQALQNMSNTAQGVMARLASMGRMVGIALGVREVMQAAQSWQMLEAKLRIVTKGKADAAEMMEKLYAASQRTRSSLSATADLFTRVARSADQLGKSLDEIMRFTETVQQAVMLSGATTQEATNGVIQLGQALASGRLQGDEFRSIMENLGGVAYYMAKGLGTTTKGLYAMRTAGTLTAQAIVDAMLKMQKEIEADFGMLPQTMEQSMTKIRNSFMKMAKGFEDETRLAEGFSRALDWVANNMDKIAGSMKHVAVIWASITATKGVNRLFGFINDTKASNQAALQTGKEAMAEARSQALLMQKLKDGDRYLNQQMARAALEKRLAATTAERTAAEARLLHIQTMRADGQARLLAATHAQNAAYKVAVANANMLTITMGRLKLASMSLLAAWWPMLAFMAAFEGFMWLWQGVSSAQKAAAEGARSFAAEQEKVNAASAEGVLALGRFNEEMLITAAAAKAMNKAISGGGEAGGETLERHLKGLEAGRKAMKLYEENNKGGTGPGSPLRDFHLAKRNEEYQKAYDNAVMLADAEEALAKTRKALSKSTEDLKKAEDGRLETVRESLEREMQALEARQKSIHAYNTEAIAIRQALADRGKTSEEIAYGNRMRQIELQLMVSKDPVERAALLRLREALVLQRQMTDMTRNLNKEQDDAAKRRKEGMDRTATAIKGAMATSKAMEEAMLEGARSIHSTFQTLFSDIFRYGQLSFKKLADSVLDIIAGMLASIAAMMTIKALGLDKLMKAIMDGSDDSLGDTIKKALGKNGGRATAGLIGFGVGYGVGGATKSKTIGMGAGIGAGVMAGAAFGAPGMIIGGLAGAVGGLFGASKAQSEAARLIKEASIAFSRTFRDYTSGANPLQRELNGIKDQRDNMAKELFEIIAKGGSITGETGPSNQWYRALEEAMKKNPQYIEALRKIDAAYKEMVDNAIAARAREIVATKEDLSVRLLSAQGKEREAEALRKQIEWQRELDEAIEMYGDDAPEIVNTLKEIIALEKKRYEEERSRAMEAYLKSLNQGQFSVLGPEAQYDSAKAELYELFRKAQAGDLEAQDSLPEAANRFLELARTMFASGQGYVDAFNLVNELLGKFVTHTEKQENDKNDPSGLKRMEDQLRLAQEAVDYQKVAIGSIDSFHSETIEALNRLNDSMYPAASGGGGGSSGPSGFVPVASFSATPVSSEDVTSELRAQTRELHNLVSLTFTAAKNQSVQLDTLAGEVAGIKRELKTTRLTGAE